MRIAYQFLGFGIILGTDRICSILVDGLGHQSEMSHDGNTGAEDTLHRTDDFLASLQFEGVGMAFFHNTDSGSQSLQFVALIRAERHVDNDHGTLHTANHGFAMINHLVERDGKRGDIACHYIGSGISHQNHVYPGTVHNLRHSIVIRCQH